MKINSVNMFEKLNHLDIKIRYTLFAVVLVVILAIDFLTIVPFQWSSLRKTNADNLTLQQNIDRLKVELQRIDQIKSGLNNSKIELEDSKKNVQLSSEVPSILEEISRLANVSDVKINQLKPQIESQQALMSSGGIKYFSLPIVIQASSSYHAFGRFLSQLEAANLIFTFSSFKMENHSEDMRQHSVNVTVRVILSEKDMDENKDKVVKKK